MAGVCVWVILLGKGAICFGVREGEGQPDFGFGIGEAELLQCSEPSLIFCIFHAVFLFFLLVTPCYQFGKCE